MSLLNKILEFLEKRISLNELVSFITSFGIFYTPLPHDKPVKEAIKDAMETPSPSYTRWPYLLGILTFILFIFCVVSGTMLLFYYIPSKENAYSSTVDTIINKPFGFFIFNFHYFSSITLLVILIFRLIRFIYHKVFSPPREFFWILAYLLFLLIVFEYITGISLPMDGSSGFMSYRIYEIISPIPIIGSLYKIFLFAGELSDFSLLRSYIFHIIILPFFIFFLFYLHFLSVRKLGLSDGYFRGDKVFPGYFFEILIIVFLAFAIIFTLSNIFPRKISEPFVPYKNYVNYKVPFFLLFFDFLRTNLNQISYSILSFILIIFPFFLPWIDRTPPIPLIKKPLTFFLYILFFSVLIFISLLEFLK
ncbi:MAG: cytochrome b N-terminal domain-containing protein [candidate division WOR-3 bacterium]